MSCVAFEDAPIDDFDPDYFHCEVCDKDYPIEFAKFDGYLYQCPMCFTWQEGE